MCLYWAARAVMKTNAIAVSVFALYVFAVLFYLVLVLNIIIFSHFQVRMCARFGEQALTVGYALGPISGVL